MANGFSTAENARNIGRIEHDLDALNNKQVQHGHDIEGFKQVNIINADLRRDLQMQISDLKIELTRMKDQLRYIMPGLLALQVIVAVALYWLFYALG